MCNQILAAVLLILSLPDIADLTVRGDDLVKTSAPLGLSMRDFMADPGVVNVYQECAYKGWPIVARLGTVREPSIQQPSKVVAFLFIKNSTVSTHLEYFRTPQGRYVVLIAFPAAVVDKALADFIKK